MGTLEDAKMPSLRDKQLAEERARLEELEAKKKSGRTVKNKKSK